MEENAPNFLCVRGVSSRRILRAAEPSRVRDVSLAIEPGTLNVLWGNEGSGKNLLLRLLGLLETPDVGEVFLHGAPTRALDEQLRLALRNQHFGFVFDEPFLLDAFSVTENVAMPLFKISGSGVDEARKHTERVLEFVGLSEQAQTGVASLSPFDQRRVSLARALVNRPEMLIVEDVDARVAARELAGFGEIVQRAKTDLGITVIMSASSAVLECDRAIQLEAGAVAHDSHPVPAGGARA